jgi:hypothetical protein
MEARGATGAIGGRTRERGATDQRATQVLAAAAHDPLNANDRINRCARAHSLPFRDPPSTLCLPSPSLPWLTSLPLLAPQASLLNTFHGRADRGAV